MWRSTHCLRYILFHFCSDLMQCSESLNWWSIWFGSCWKDGRTTYTSRHGTKLSGPIVSSIALIAIFRFEWSFKYCFDDNNSLKICFFGSWYRSHFPIDFGGSVPLSCNSIPRSSSLAPKLLDVNPVYWPNFMIPGSPEYTDVHELTSSTESSSAAVYYIKITFWKLVLVSTTCNTGFAFKQIRCIAIFQLNMIWIFSIDIEELNGGTENSEHFHTDLRYFAVVHVLPCLPFWKCSFD